MTRYCCPIHERREGDRTHWPHPNIAQWLDHRPTAAAAAAAEQPFQRCPPAHPQSSATATDAPGAAATACPPAPSHTPTVATATVLRDPNQEREEAKRIVLAAMAKIKASFKHDSNGTAASADADSSSGGGLDWLSRLSQPVLSVIERSAGGGMGASTRPLDEELTDVLNSEQLQESSLTAAPVQANKMVQLRLRRRTAHSVRLPIKGSELVSWAFSVTGGDIGFGATFRSQGSAFPDVVVVPWARYPAGRELLHTGEWLPTHLRGELTFTWDNTYSRLRAKQLQFEIQHPTSFS